MGDESYIVESVGWMKISKQENLKNRDLIYHKYDSAFSGIWSLDRNHGKLALMLEKAGTPWTLFAEKLLSAICVLTWNSIINYLQLYDK